MPLTEDEVRTVGNAILGELTDRLSIPQIRMAVGRAGFDTSRIPGEDRRASVVPAVQNLFGELSSERKLTAIRILADQMPPQVTNELLRHHGYQYVNGSFVPFAAFDAREVAYLPTSSAGEIATAFDRLVRGDDDGAIAAACGAVDTATNRIYEKRGLGRPPDSFQAKINTVMDVLQNYDEMEAELVELNIKPETAKEIVDELHETIKHAANALQVMRRVLGDVHGKKPAYTRLTYVAIKWASAICGLLEGKT